ncbi:hypothetical protein AWM75_03355 [Aerococcus urinaehominis]|uniref:Uncharacterized protein n=1 Tax=Aerococcus urinaehominis TaxID=128944 RepID=A0A109RGX8_9LACT|nr:hypothetical protein [Aerococcus urinaehominis]AMB99096.1 hypothetical protein AWM75_03355 [Aerococcus urinaehominis]SDM03505.1 hypothetical protein SAMN04487985_10429 [Aerococcus urinaehominis]
MRKHLALIIISSLIAAGCAQAAPLGQMTTNDQPTSVDLLGQNQANKEMSQAAHQTDQVSTFSEPVKQDQLVSHNNQTSQSVDSPEVPSALTPAVDEPSSHLAGHYQSYGSSEADVENENQHVSDTLPADHESDQAVTETSQVDQPSAQEETDYIITTPIDEYTVQEEVRRDNPDASVANLVEIRQRDLTSGQVTQVLDPITGQWQAVE